MGIGIVVGERKNETEFPDSYGHIHEPNRKFGKESVALRDWEAALEHRSVTFEDRKTAFGSRRITFDGRDGTFDGWNSALVRQGVAFAPENVPLVHQSSVVLP
jgi:hypothetical protein